MREGFIETKGGRIWYSVYGEDKSGTPLLVLHGGPGFLSMTQGVSDFVVDRPVYFYDQLGSGKSDRAADQDYYSVKNFVNELDEVIKELKLVEVILMGFSWGCGLACSYMLEKKPKGVKAIILSAPYLSSPLWDKDQRDHIAKMPSEVIKYPELHKIIVPVLLICGDRDEAGVKTVKDFQMAFPHAQMAVIPNASHLHQIEQPRIYQVIVNEFLKNK